MSIRSLFQGDVRKHFAWSGGSLKIVNLLEVNIVELIVPDYKFS